MRKLITTACLPLLLALVGVASALGSEGVDDIALMARAGISEEVQIAFIEQSSVAYEPTVEEIILLHDLGLSNKVITAMIEHGRQLSAQTGSTAPAAAESSPAIDAVLEEPAQSLATTASAEETYSPTAVYAPPEEQYDLSFFYEALSPYGTWIDSSEYGRCWQPAAVVQDPEWRPYANEGHWVWTDYGWYWQSSYSWGWAPFHYGRWAYSPRHRWTWCPDTTWGSAWVQWRNGSDYCGWAPLPPHATYEAGLGFSWRGNNVSLGFDFGLSDRDYCFVPTRHFASRDWRQHRAAPTQVTNIYNNTTIVNNTYIYNDNRIINRGVPVDTVAQASGTPIRPVAVDRALFRPGARVTGERRRGDRIEAFRPEIANRITETPEQIAARRQATNERWTRERGQWTQEARGRQRELQQQGQSGAEAQRHAQTEARSRFLDEVRRRDTTPTPESLRLRNVDEQGRDRSGEVARRQAERRAGPGTESESSPRLRASPDISRRGTDLEAQRRATDESARRQAETEARQRAELEGRRRSADELRRPQADAQRRAAEESTRRQVESEARQRAEASGRQRSAEEIRRPAVDAQRRAAEEMTRRQAETETRQRAELEGRQRAELEGRQRSAAEAQRRATAETQQRAAEAQQRAAAETQQRAAAQAQQRAAAEAQQRAAAEGQRRAAEAQQRAAAEAQQRAAAQAQQRAAGEGQRRAAEAQQRAAAEAQQRAAALAQQRAAEEAAKKLQQDQQQQTEQTPPNQRGKHRK